MNPSWIRVYRERVKLSPGAEPSALGSEAGRHTDVARLGRFTHVTDRLKTRLGLDYTRSNTLGVSGGKLTGEIEGRIVNADGKREALLAVRDELGIAKGPDHRDRRRRERPQVHGRGRRQHRLSTPSR
jgi:phosphoserine phosphatase